MTALIILAHGSRRTESNQEIIELADKVAAIAKKKYKLVTYAFLEVVEPKLLHAIDMLIEQSIDEIIVLPYFLNSGNHVTHDIPEIIELAKLKYSDCIFRLAPCVGLHQDMPKLILSQAELNNF